MACNLEKVISVFISIIDPSDKKCLYENLDYCVVGDFMIVTVLKCWWQNHYVDDIFSI